MTSREFIQRQFGNADGKSRELSSIYKDSNGQIYSYYHHYPLLFKVGGLTFRNTRGYSSTTGKHINWAQHANALDVELTGCNQYSWRNNENKAKVPYMLYERATYQVHQVTDASILRAILTDYYGMLDRVEADMRQKTRQDTRVYRELATKQTYIKSCIERVKAAIK